MTKKMITRILTGLILLTIAVDALAYTEQTERFYLRGAAESDPGNYAIYGSTIGRDVPYTSISSTSANYYCDFTSIDHNDFGNTVYAIKGAEYDNGDPNTFVGTVPYLSEYPDDTGGIGVGREKGHGGEGATAYWLTGKVIWHVQAPYGTVFTGGKANLYAHAEGFYWPRSTDKYSLRLVDKRPVFDYQNYTIPAGAIDLITTFSHWAGDPCGTTAYHWETLTLNIPSGKSEFWLIFENSWPQLVNNYYPPGTYSTALLRNININAQTKTDPCAPIPVLLYSGDATMLKYEWKRSLKNEVGLSGIIADSSWKVGIPDANIFSAQAGIQDLIGSGAGIGLGYFGVDVYFGQVATWWPARSVDRDPCNPSDPWTNAIRSISSVAQVANASGIQLIIFDTEFYPSDSNPIVGNYIFSGAWDNAANAKAYQRGLEVGQAIRAKAPGVAVMMIPEYGAQVFATIPIWNKFRSGLMAAQQRTYVGLETTYGIGTRPDNVNGNSIMIRNMGVNYPYTDPVAYKAALTTHLNNIKSQLRASCDNPTDWDNYGGIAPGFSCLGTWSDREGKGSAWYPPQLFAAQLETYVACGAKLIWEWTWGYPWHQWHDNEVAAAGRYPYGEIYGNPNNPDYWPSWYAALGTHPYLDAYTAVLRARGTPNQPWKSFSPQQPGDINGDGYVNFKDVSALASNWLKSSPTNGL